MSMPQQGAGSLEHDDRNAHSHAQSSLPEVNISYGAGDQDMRVFSNSYHTLLLGKQQQQTDAMYAYRPRSAFMKQPRISAERLEKLREILDVLDQQEAANPPIHEIGPHNKGALELAHGRDSCLVLLGLPDLSSGVLKTLLTSEKQEEYRPSSLNINNAVDMCYLGALSSPEDNLHVKLGTTRRRARMIRDEDHGAQHECERAVRAQIDPLPAIEW